MTQTQRLVAILPCNDLDRSEAFYRRLGFEHRDGDDDYRMLSDGRGGELHLNKAVEGWVIPGRNPFGLYLYTEEWVARPRPSRGECMNSRSPTPMKRWFVSAGPRGSGGRTGSLPVHNPFTAASRLAASDTLNICAVLSMRFINPLSAEPGPSSINRVNPWLSR